MENKNKANSQAGNAKDRKRANGANSNANFNGSAKNVRKMKQLGMRCKQLLQCKCIYFSVIIYLIGSLIN